LLTVATIGIVGVMGYYVKDSLWSAFTGSLR
jgi:hypothetical protein